MNLITLDIAGFHITDDVLISISNHKSLKNLSLYVYNRMNITDHGISSLSNIKTLLYLRIRYTNACMITDSSICNIIKALPWINIDIYNPETIQ